MPTLLLDRFHVGLVLLGTAGILFLAAEIPFRVARARQEAANARKPYAELLTGALFSLFGLMLAFSFAMAESRFAERRRLVIQDANAIRTTYLRAGTIDADRGARVRAQLREYVDLRVLEPTAENLPRIVQKSSELQSAIWAEAEAYARLNPESEMANSFAESVTRMIEVHHERLGVAVSLRLPPQVFAALYLIAVLATALLGYNAGLAGRRAFMPGGALVLSISLLATLIIDLERPTQQFFEVSRQPMIELRDAIRQ